MRRWRDRLDPRCPVGPNQQDRAVAHLTTTAGMVVVTAADTRLATRLLVGDTTVNCSEISPSCARSCRTAPSIPVSGVAPQPVSRTDRGCERLVASAVVRCEA